MDLVIDIGNTQVKSAVFAAEDIVVQETFTADILAQYIVNTCSEHDIKRMIFSNVAKIPEKLINTIPRCYDVHLLTHKSKIPFTNNYASPETLGVDRIALVAAAAHQFPEKNVLIIDAGTCITYDFLTAENKYLGGAISPGIQMRYEALHTFTEHLPLLHTDDMMSRLIGNSTSTSIHSGVGNGVCLEVDGVIDRYREKYEVLTVILTGGDSHFLSKRLKNSIFAFPSFLMRGLYVILEHNKD